MLASPGFSPPATELDLNSAAVRGDREGDRKRREVKNTSGQQKRKKRQHAQIKKRKTKDLGCPLVQCVVSRKLCMYGALS